MIMKANMVPVTANTGLGFVEDQQHASRPTMSAQGGKIALRKISPREAARRLGVKPATLILIAAPFSSRLSRYTKQATHGISGRNRRFSRHLRSTYLQVL
jgi:hypothetical protein